MSDDQPTEEAVASEGSGPESPALTLREQLIALVPDESKSQAADLIRSLLEHSPPPSAPAEEQKESPKVAKRYEHLPFRPRVTREETPKKERESSSYGSFSE